jgi:YggT family protein
MTDLLIALIRGFFFVVDALLFFIIVAVIASAILSWLVAFDVVNLRNRTAYSIAHFLESVTRPILRPFRRIIPPLGGVDLSPMVALLIIMALQRFLLPTLEVVLVRLVAPSGVIL